MGADICKNIDESHRYYADPKKLDKNNTYCTIPNVWSFWQTKLAYGTKK